MRTSRTPRRACAARAGGVVAVEPDPSLTAVVSPAGAAVEVDPDARPPEPQAATAGASSTAKRAKRGGNWGGYPAPPPRQLGSSPARVTPGPARRDPPRAHRTHTPPPVAP